MYYVYLLVDDAGKKYFGSTNDLKRRYLQHLKKQGSKTSKKMNGLKVYYYELKKFGSAYSGLSKRIGLK